MCRTTTTTRKTTLLQDDEEWIETFDLNKFAADIRDLGERLRKEQGPDDVRHLKKMVMWCNLCGLVGMATMGYNINLVAIVGLSTWTFSRWTMIAHHVCHGGYDSIHPNKNRWHRFKFAIGSFWNRLCDWFDWMMPEAWNVEHNNRHHYKLSEADDPDLVEANLKDLREAPVPVLLKYVVVLMAMATWKWFYYSPNTYKELKLARLRKQGKPLPKGVNPEDAVTIRSILMGMNPFYSAFELFSVVLGPYLILHFFVLPMPYLALGRYLELDDVNSMYWTAVKNLALAEVLTNIHGFVAVVTNHAGDDMYRFSSTCRAKSGSFYLRQVLASVDFSMGSDIVDFLHGWLNYQIEHHLWPDLSMLSYQKAAPHVRAICAKHKVPYVQEHVFIRVKKTIDIMVGNSSMKKFPPAYEQKYLEQDAIFLKQAMSKVTD